MFGRIRPYSHVNQDFIWMGEYANGTSLLEFDLETKESNNFYQLKRESLIRFGLIGHGMNLFYEVYGGFFKVNGSMIEVIYKVGDKEYYLTGQPKMYNDVITYKDAESSFDASGKRSGDAMNRITQFNFGYKANLSIDDTEFNFKAILGVPFNAPAYIHFRLVADKELDGKLLIKKDGIVVSEYDAPLKTDVGGELNWVVR